MIRKILIHTFLSLITIQSIAAAADFYVPSRDYPTIQSAIDDADNGDTVIVAPGVWTGPGNVDLNFDGRAITVKSQINPDNPDPAIIASTIIDCDGDRYEPHRAFWFNSGEGHDSQVLGFTIINGYQRGPAEDKAESGYVGEPIDFFVPEPIVDDPLTAPPIALDGNDISGDGYGGGIYCSNSSSPTIGHCVISNCVVTGAQGGDGADGLSAPWSHWTLEDYEEDPPPPDAEQEENDNGQWGGNGGTGTGTGYGGAIACRNNSSPVIVSCTIINNSARGGCGGIGGAGGSSEDGDYGWGGNGGDSIGDGKGGGIYCDWNSSPTITDCVFSNNVAATGIRGSGGPNGTGEPTDPFNPSSTGFDGFVFSNGGIAGGAAYYEEDSDADFTNCVFIENMAYEAYGFYSSFLLEDIESYTIGGAIFSQSSNAINLDDCTFTDNKAGAVYCGINSFVDIEDCNFVNNSETSSGGALYIDRISNVNLDSCVFGGNAAYEDGGAVKSRSNATLTRCSFSNNTAGAYGGAIDVYRPGTTLTIDADGCSFSGNQSAYGGGFSSENFNATFTDCYFIGNTAEEGGGLHLFNGQIDFIGGSVSENNATDSDGGGFFCGAIETYIRDCAMNENSADGEGGAINFYGGTASKEVFNCLFTCNSAVTNGGAISCNNAEPDIGNCTFSDNYAGGFGGAIFSNYLSDVSIIDSIFQHNHNHAIHEEDFTGEATVTYSIFYENPDGDYYDSGTGEIYKGAGEIGSIPGGSNNLYNNCDFLTGPLGDFYIDQGSSAINSGSDTAANLGLDTYTTATNEVPDSEQVDRGYHYFTSASVEQFQLNTSVVGGQGSILPPSGPYYAGTTITLTAVPDSGWVVKSWSGTDNDSSTSTTNSVLMNSNKSVSVEFRQPQTLLVSVGGGPGYYSNIPDAVADAEDGDTVIVFPGTYYGAYNELYPSYGMVYLDKSITVRSEQPDDPVCVAATILDGYNGYEFNEGFNNVGVRFGSNTDSDTIFNGFTIQNCGGTVGVAPDGDRDIGHPDGFDGGCIEGPGIYVYPGGSPVIKNCVIRDNLLIAGDGGNGVDAEDYANAGRGGWAGWARGGGVYCAAGSSPKFINCQIINNFATGGNGGNGGADALPGGWANYGGNWSKRGSPEDPALLYDPFSLDIEYVFDAHLWERWQWDYALFYNTYLNIGNGVNYFGDYRWYSGYGGGAFCDEGSNVTFTNCTISENFAQGGISGQGGTNGDRPTEPLIPYQIPSYGGGVYCAADAMVMFNECTIADNNSSEPDPGFSQIDPYLGHGGGVCAEDTATVIFNNCTISGNQASVGGGMNFANANPKISETTFSDNLAFHGGGIYGNLGNAIITDCLIINNEASTDIDPDYNDIGNGGGLHFWATDANIINTEITGNEAEVSGGGVYFGGEGIPGLINCLITSNTANRDGGGLSANIFSQPIISNCTIADNLVTGTGYANSYGGGVSCVSANYTTIIDSIIWGNRAVLGGQIAVGTEFDDSEASTANISYSSVGPRYTYSSGISFSGSGSSQTQGGGTTVIDGDIITGQFDAGAETVKVIVSLYEPITLRNETDWSSPSSVDILRAEIATRQNSVLSTLSPSEFTLRHQYENQAAFSGEVTPEGFDSIVSHSLVEYVEPVREVYKMLAQAIPLANATLPRQVYDGSGVAVAIVDTGVDYTHPMLGGGTFPNTKVIGGYDTAEDDDDPIPANDAHGTCCAGIAAGSLGTVGDYIGGVAYNAKIYALKVVEDGSPAFMNEDTLAAWDWCVTNQNLDPANPIMVISNSWALYGFPINNPAEGDAISPAHTVAAQNAVNVGITILAASGNDGFAGQGISWPSAMSNVISVGAVYDTTDQVTEYSNTADILDILAPADPVYTTDIVGADGYDLGDYYPFFNGTSSACPFAAGSVAMMQSASMIEAGRYLLPEEIRDILVATGDAVTDTKVTITKPRINLVQAMEVEDLGPIHVEAGSQIENNWWNPDTLSWDPASNNLSVDDDPCFVTGPQGNYYLSQIEAGQVVQSPCVDTGSGDAHSLGMYRHTTRTDNKIDQGIIDMGYHYLLGSDLQGDFNFDGFVDFCQDQGKDSYWFMLHWLDSGCTYPDWCHHKDLNQDGIVNFKDYTLAMMQCGASETAPPEPDPMTWETPPYSVDSNTISMTATQAVDDYSGFGVEYYFECSMGAGSDSGWSTDRNYIDSVSDLDTYCYQVRARDELLNETGWSSEICVTISGGGGQEPDAPNPPSGLTATAISSVQIDLAWTDNSTDEDGFRIERSEDGTTFVQIATVATDVTTYSDAGLQPVTTYWYRVRAYNNNGNSAYSNVASATTFSGPAPDTEPPLPNPPTWASGPTNILDPLNPGFYAHTMTANTSSDATTGGNDPVEYYFECINNGDFSSGWQTETTYTSPPIAPVPYSWSWRFKVRDAVGNVTQYSSILMATTGEGG